MNDFVNKYVFNLFSKTASEGAVLFRQVASKRTCHILVMSEELSTSVNDYTLIAWAHSSQTITELRILEPYYVVPCMSSTAARTQSVPVWATCEDDEGLE